MKLKGLLVLAILSSVLFVSAVRPSVTFNEKESMILNAVINYLDALHFKPATIDDSFSEQAFDNYIQMIDPSKRFLIQPEVDQLSASKDLIDDQIEARSFQFFESSIGVIDNSRQRAKDIFYKVIEEDLSKVKGKIEMDREKREFVQNEEELTDLWRKLIKYDLNSRLRSKIKSQEEKIKKHGEANSEKAEGDEPAEPLVIKTEDELKTECIDAIKKSYETSFKNMDKDRRSDKFETYVNSITHLFDPHSDYLNPKEKEDFDIRMGGKLEVLARDYRSKMI